MSFYEGASAADRHWSRLLFTAVVSYFSLVVYPSYACMGTKALTKAQLSEAEIVIVADVLEYKSRQKSNSASVALRPLKYLKGEIRFDVLHADWVNFGGVPDYWSQPPTVIVALLRAPANHSNFQVLQISCGGGGLMHYSPERLQIINNLLN